MSHSQFHSTNLFILRHAWLNLWDKHMTTGRINQVTTFPTCCEEQQMSNQILGTAQRAHLSLVGVRLWFDKSQPSEKPRSRMWLLMYSLESKPPCSPISHLFRPMASCLLQQKLWPSERTTCDWQNQKYICSPSRGGFPSVLIATSLANSK